MSTGSEEKEPWNKRITTEEVVAAYRECGSVWKTGERVGLSGQTVWERLRAIGHPMQHPRWTREEIAELERRHYEGWSLTQIATRLGRPYGSVATQISQRGLSNGRGRQMEIKLERGAGWDKGTTKRRIQEIELYNGSIHRWCRVNGLKLDSQVQAIQRHFPDWWDEYARTHSDLPQAECPNCQRTFYPMTKKQKACSRRCQTAFRTDQAYYGGRRSEAIGLSEGICQLCGETGRVLSAHHMFGKEADPENRYLIALCNGCHRLVGVLAGRKFVDETQNWETLINLAMLRRLGPTPAIRTYVDIEILTQEEADEEAEYEEPDMRDIQLTVLASQ